MMTDSMIERVARAICDEIAHDHDGEFVVEGGFRGDDFFADIARTVLAAMREPTNAMIEAWTDASPAGDVMAMSDEDANAVCATADWQAMVDAALAEGE